jgi:hypothetical protein
MNKNGVARTGLLLSAAAAMGFGACAAQAQNYSLGQAVEIEASNHWVPCVVVQTAAVGDIMRVKCTEYPQLSRAAGVYIVRNDPGSIRLAGSGRRAGAAAVPASAKVSRPAARAAAGAGLKVGEYACYGSGGRIMIGLGFKVLAGGRYTDLDGGNAGRFSIAAGTVRFQGGHLGGQVGRLEPNGSFGIGQRARCEPW